MYSGHGTFYSQKGKFSDAVAERFVAVPSPKTLRQRHPHFHRQLLVSIQAPTTHFSIFVRCYGLQASKKSLCVLVGLEWPVGEADLKVMLSID